MTVEPVLGWGPWLVTVIVHVIRAPRATVTGAVLVIARSADGEIAGGVMGRPGSICVTSVTRLRHAAHQFLPRRRIVP